MSETHSYKSFEWKAKSDSVIYQELEGTIINPLYKKSFKKLRLKVDRNTIHASSSNYGPVLSPFMPFCTLSEHYVLDLSTSSLNSKVL